MDTIGRGNSKGCDGDGDGDAGGLTKVRLADMEVKNGKGC